MGVLPFNIKTRDKVPKQLHQPMHKLIEPHIESFNFMLREGLDKAVSDLDGHELFDSHGNRMKIWLASPSITKPMLPEREQHSIDRLIYPAEARERLITYKGKLRAQVMWQVNNEIFEEYRDMAEVPLMVKSDACNLAGKTPQQLVELKEEHEEMGGYFIINGNEKIIRLLILPRRHYITGMQRKAYRNRGPLYTDWGCSIRCVRPDQSSQTITVHYLTDGTCVLRFSQKKTEYLIPAIIVLKALADTTDREIFNKIRCDPADAFVGDRVEAMLRDALDKGMYTRKQCLAHLGKMFRVVMDAPRDFTDEQVGSYLLRKHIFVHCQSDKEKYDLLVCMIQKLYKLVSGEVRPDNPDSPMMQEALMGGHLYLMIIKESLDLWTQQFKKYLEVQLQRNPSASLADPDFVQKAMGKVPFSISRRLENFLATGNLNSPSGLDLQQVSGFVIVADKLNFNRYLSHFRCIHRGAFFAEMKTTTVRKLMPEAWGFLCPVHTPDGAPCGLLNHLSHTCEIVNHKSDTSALPAILVSLGMVSVQTGLAFPPHFLPVMLDGVLIGKVDPAKARPVAERLRYLKADHSSSEVPEMLEIALVLPAQGGLFPGMYLFTSLARFMRPVQYLPTGQTEMIGSFEQVYMNIALCPEEIYEGQTTHMELHPTNILSVVANMTPFSDFNQSPRNMYQCQMGKQTMGTPMHSFPYRTDNKIYRIQTPQAPIVRNTLYNHYRMDNYPTGTNAVVAVISYTGYDMEDAMIINKGAKERGFGHGSVYKAKIVDLTKERSSREKKLQFGLAEKDRKKYQNKLDSDGFPPVGTLLKNDDPLYSVIDEATNSSKVVKYKDTEEAFVEEVRLLGSDMGDAPAQRAHIKLRVIRNPVIGDKFSSRHGQKGVCSRLWPMEDMPFTESGIQPDVIINPHAFPSRMTIGMLIESMAAKGGALHGLCHDATPFTFDEKNTAVDYFGEQLRKAGYHYYGNERMYSGITGTELEVDIFIGVVYYQRLRHMVSDKFQVRTTGPIDPKTRQPVKGRKRAGGIRLGEMERDSLLAHGTAYLLHDRLFNCSDASTCHVCTSCGSILSSIADGDTKLTRKQKVTCRVCDNGGHIETVAMPYVFRYLAAELLAMNINVTLDVK
eukprot:comp20793_c0_seq1/m.27332 comp20793_c0_seq1/g.27332  ORF comp20793_c0_seq1/g.27332 comp20793_c0_seq1/m.27332 type:complete len:1123 (-) comp20793_c0_seq1:450-3818(-)